MKCPKCGSENVQFATKTSGGGFSFFDSCCGFIFLGPLGLLCGACGSGTSTEEFWVCHDCGNRFSTGAGKRKMEKDLADEQKAAQTYKEYKTELNNRGITKELHQKVKDQYFEAYTQYETAKKNSQALLQEAKTDGDRTIRKCAKGIDGKIIKFIIFGLGLIGFLCFYSGLFAFGVAMIVIPAVLWIIHEFKADKLKQRLTEISPKFNSAFEEEKVAEENLGNQKYLYDMVYFVESYEAKHETS